MDYPAKLEFKDMPDGSLGVAVHFEGELPGVTPGKRSYLVDSVQFWLNKVVNRPNVARRWVNLGVNGFPEPRMPGQPREPREEKAPQQQQPLVVAQAPAQKPQRVKEVKAAPAPASAPAKAAPASAPAPAAARPPRRDEKRPGAPVRGDSGQERSLTPAADPLITSAGKLLAEKAAKLGRVYGVMGLSADQRALMLKAAEGLTGVTAKAEGEGHWRRLVLVPEKLAVIAKKQVMPDYDDEDEDE